MRFDTRLNKSNYFSEATNSAAATASFSITAATRNLMIQQVSIVSDLSGAIITIGASGTTKWKMQAGSAMVPAVFPGLTIENGSAQTMSANLTASSLGGYIAICGVQQLL